MRERLRQLVGAVLLWLVVATAGCVRPLDVAIITSNAAAATLNVRRVELLEARTADQTAAAKAVRGPRSDPRTIAKQFAAAQAVADIYAPALADYGRCFGAWLLTQAAIAVAIDYEAAGVDPPMGPVHAALAALASQQIAFAAAAAKLGVTDGR